MLLFVVPLHLCSHSHSRSHLHRTHLVIFVCVFVYERALVFIVVFFVLLPIKFNDQANSF